MLRKLALSLAIAGAIGTSNANALGLGEIKITSALNEPLQAEIQLLQMRDVEPQQIQPKMANIDEFALAGIEKLRFLSDVQFEVKPGPAGRGIIVLSSAVPVKEPFLNFLVEVNWPSGRLVREYTVLLDPPVYDPTPTATSVQPAQAAAVTTPSPVTATKMDDAAPVDNIRTRMSEKQIYVDVNDTLWNLAKKYKPSSSVSEAQMMLALQRKNPDAFANNNVNELKAGVVMDLPSLEEVQALSQKQANEEFWRQTQLWKQGGSVKAAETEQMDASSADKKSMEEAAKKDSEVAAKSAEGQLKIVSPGKEGEQTETGKVSDQAADKEVSQSEAELLERNQQLETELATALESVDQIQRENEELTGRVDALAQQMESLQRLLELKDQQLAELQAELDAAKAQPVAPVAPQPQPKGLLEEFGMYIYGAGAAVIALLAGLLFMMRRRKKSEDEAQDVVEQPVAAAAAEVVEEAAEETVEDVVEEETAEAVEDVADELSDTDLDDLDLDMDLDEVDQVSDSTIDDDEFDLGLDDIDEAVEEAAEPEVVEDVLPEEEEVDDALDSILGEDTESMDLEELSIDTLDEDLAELADSDETPDSLDDLLESGDEVADEELDFDVKPLEDEVVEESAAEDDDHLELDFDLDEPEAAVEGEVAEDDQALDDMLSADEGELEDLDSLLGETDEDGDAGEVAEDDASEFADLEELLGDDSDEAELEPVSEDEIADLDELLAGVDEADIEEIAAEEPVFETAMEEPETSELHPELEELLDDAVAEDEIVLEEQDLSADADDELEASISHDLDAELDSELEDLLSDAGSEELSLDATDDSDGDESFDSLNLLEGADEVETKLDLARAYIDMEDFDGAKDILQEIIKEGSDTQQKEANNLLGSIN